MTANVDTVTSTRQAARGPNQAGLPLRALQLATPKVRFEIGHQHVHALAHQTVLMRLRAPS